MAEIDDARLIDAAYDLLEACRALIAADGPTGLSYEAVQTALRFAREAVAKAGRAEPMTDKEEAAYIRGRRMAWSRMLDRCLGELGYEDAASAGVAWVAEREGIVAALRDVCEDFGDNDWEPEDNLADVIEKHLGKHLHAADD